jgi:hypothetical protein
MPKRPSTDPNLFAKSVFDKLLAKYDPDSVPSEPQPETPNPKAQAAGRKGGLVGGKARAKALTPKKRKQIAKKAANSRWAGKKDN